MTRKAMSTQKIEELNQEICRSFAEMGIIIKFDRC